MIGERWLPVLHDHFSVGLVEIETQWGPNEEAEYQIALALKDLFVKQAQAMAEKD